MQIPPIIELEDVAKKLVWVATKKGTLKELTPRLVRQTIETQLGLEEGCLDIPEYKSAIKSATKSALDEDPPPSEGEETQKPTAKVNKKRKSDIKHEDDLPTPRSRGKSSTAASKDKEDEGSAQKKRKTAKAKKIESEDEEERSGDNEETESKTTKKKRQRKDTKQFKSLEHVPTSDMEQDEPNVVNIAGPSITKAVSPKKKDSPVRQKADPSKSAKEAENPESKPTNNLQSTVPDVVMGDSIARDMSSELSELDEPKPKQKQKQKAKIVNKEPRLTTAKEKQKNTKSSTTLSKDEETIKRLKSLVLACGVRKVWSKVFQDLDSPHQQIKKLKEILSDLGMTGRMSMEQAKTIKRKRELAQELEDVQQFEKAVLGGSSRSRTQPAVKGPAVEEEDSEQDKRSGSEDEYDDEAGSSPRRRPVNARKSIMAFLQDQSGEE